MPPSMRLRATRRARWTERRRRIGLLRPLPVDVGVVNAKGVTAPPRVVDEILRQAALEADVLFCSEVANVRVAVALGSAWQVAQFGELGSDDSGAALAVRRTAGRLEGERLVPGSKAALGIRDRPLVAARIVLGQAPRLWMFDAGAGHAPPKRAWAIWPEFMAAARRLRLDVAGADWNKLARAVAPALRRRVRGVHVLGLAVRWWIPSSKPRAVDVGSDHPMVVVTLWPRR